jgi:hypothetical protein
MTEESGGIVISGGTVNIGALAQGAHAKASNRQVINAGPDEHLRELIRDLLTVLREHGGELADAPAVQSASSEAAAELEQARPDRSRIRALLDRITAAAGPIADIAAAVAAVRSAI